MGVNTGATWRIRWNDLRDDGDAGSGLSLAVLQQLDATT